MATRNDLRLASVTGAGPRLPVLVDEIGRLTKPNGDVVGGAVVWGTSRQFAGGADPSGVRASSVAINEAAAFAAAQSPGRPCFVMLPQGTYLLDETVILPAQCFLVGEGSGNGSTPMMFIPAANGTYIGGWMILINSNDGITAASNIYAANYIGGVIGARFNNWSTNIPGLRGAMAFGSGFFMDIRGQRMMCTVKRPAGHYIDRFTCIRVSCDQEHSSTTEYQIDIDGTGDTVLIDRSTFPDSGGVTVSGGTNPIKAVRISNSNALLSCASATVRGCINGDYLFKGVKALKMEVFHQEFGTLTFDRTNYTLSDTYIAVKTGLTTEPIVNTSPDNNAGYMAFLQNVEFMWGFSNFRALNNFEIRNSSAYHVHLENVYRVIDASGASPNLTGVRVCDQNGNALTNFAQYSQWLSQNGVIEGGIVGEARRNVVLPSSYSGIGFIQSVNAGQGDWDAATGTYYYTTQFLLDTSAMVGLTQTNAEVQATVSSAQGRIVAMTMFYGAGLQPSGILRVYRGTSPGSYSQFCDIPVVMSRGIMDTGSRVQGLPWQSRAAGPVDSIRAGASVEWVISSPGSIRRVATETVTRSANATFGAFGGSQVNIVSAPVSASFTLSAPANARNGDVARFVRTIGATGAGTVTISGLSGGATRVLTAEGQWTEAMFNGSAWVITAGGTL